MSGVTIHYQVDLVIQLIDTTTGKGISGRKVIFTKNDGPLDVVTNSGGDFIVVNAGREDFTLGIEVWGYEVSKLAICYEDLDERLPIQPVFLVPMENIGTGEGVVSLEGILEGIESVEGVNINRPYCSFSDFNEKKMEMTVFGPQGAPLSMNDCFYGLINDQTSFERIEVLKKTGDSKVLVRSKLNAESKVNAPIARVIFGKVDGDRFIFRVRDDASVLMYLIRYVVKGEERFRLVNFNEPETLNLT